MVRSHTPCIPHFPYTSLDAPAFEEKYVRFVAHLYPVLLARTFLLFVSAGFQNMNLGAKLTV